MLFVVTIKGPIAQLAIDHLNKYNSFFKKNAYNIICVFPFR